jgi:hypothetical protein
MMWTGVVWLRSTDKWWATVDAVSNETSGSMKEGEFFDKVSDYFYRSVLLRGGSYRTYYVPCLV